MRFSPTRALVLIAVVAIGCKDDDDDGLALEVDAGAVMPEDHDDAGRESDAGPLDASTVDNGPDADAAGLDARTDAARDAARTDRDSDAGGEAADGGVADAALDASQADAAPSDAAADAASSDATADTGTDAPAEDASAGDDAAVAVTFARVLAILRANCGGCHTTGMSGALRFSEDAAEAYAQLVGVRAMGPACGAGTHTRVIANAPDQRSLLIQKLEPSPPCGDRMPQQRAPLAPELLAEIRSWIAAGALMN